MPPTPYPALLPRAAAPPSPSGPAPSYAAFGDPGGEHLWMRRGRFSAWPHVVLAYLAQAAWIGALCAWPIYRVASAVLLPDAALALFFFGVLMTGPAAAYFTFRHRWRCIEAFSSRFCIGLLNLSALYVPLVALVYANVRGARKLSGR